MGPMATGLAPREVTETGSEVETQRERVTWYLWPGKVLRALPGLAELAMARDAIEPVTEGRKKLPKAGHECRDSVAVNKALIPNAGDRPRHGETSSTAFADATLHQVVSRRLVTPQPMRWTPRGAPLWLPVRPQP
jgi:hypothetical protein